MRLKDKYKILNHMEVPKQEYKKAIVHGYPGFAVFRYWNAFPKKSQRQWSLWSWLPNTIVMHTYIPYL